MRILLADDDPDSLEPLEIALSREGYAVLLARDGEQAWELFQRQHPDFVVLDITMPGLGGLEVLQHIRHSNEPHVPVILLTGRTYETERVAGLNEGADDYVSKPCTARELIARIRAVWRRTERASRVLTVGELQINPSTRELTIDGRHVNLTVIEFALLQALMERAGQVVPVTALMRQVWSGDVSQDLVRVTVYRLRRKIEPDPKEPRYIQTVAGVGFILRPPGQVPIASTAAET